MVKGTGSSKVWLLNFGTNYHNPKLSIKRRYQKEFYSPTYDIDIIWHAHQEWMSFLNYIKTEPTAEPQTALGINPYFAYLRYKLFMISKQVKVQATLVWTKI